ncbi:MAG: hypothetical protein KJ709_01610 [Nanoarchaeota archaeon]|nr:hypothetical protein [Nanoarchaeota archaeon]
MMLKKEDTLDLEINESDTKEDVKRKIQLLLKLKSDKGMFLSDKDIVYYFKNSVFNEDYIYEMLDELEKETINTNIVKLKLFYPKGKNKDFIKKFGDYIVKVDPIRYMLYSWYILVLLTLIPIFNTYQLHMIFMPMFVFILYFFISRIVIWLSNKSLSFDKFDFVMIIMFIVFTVVTGGILAIYTTHFSKEQFTATHFGMSIAIGVALANFVNNHLIHRRRPKAAITKISLH